MGIQSGRRKATHVDMQNMWIQEVKVRKVRHAESGYEREPRLTDDEAFAKTEDGTDDEIDGFSIRGAERKPPSLVDPLGGGDCRGKRKNNGGEPE